LSHETLSARLRALDRASPQFAVDAVAVLLDEARRAGASDVHLHPTPEGLEVRWRLDGVLLHGATLPAALASNVVARLKVLAGLLTYKNDIPQEGRIRGTGVGEAESRVSVFPTLHGERAVVRLFADSGRFHTLDDLGLPDDVRASLVQALAETSGAVIVAGPAGSGKTTTLYACLRHLASGGNDADSYLGRSLATLEDPIEVAVPGVSQSQVNPAAGFTLESGLRSILRQDPEVIGVGEIRDRPTAEAAMQAALTGHLLLTTFHAGGAAGALGRLLDMGIEPYVIRSAVRLVVFQRLARKLCTCARPPRDPAEHLGFEGDAVRVASGCDLCRHTGYLGRIALAEAASPTHGALGQAVLARRDVDELEAAARHDGVISRFQRARHAVLAGLTSPAEAVRVLGIDVLNSHPNAEIRPTP
jgi:type II secretory ATPase GspE/PulE/Tfp pilus assembly ATPase PilB-like protein